MRRWYTKPESDVRLTNYTAFYVEIQKQYYPNVCIVDQRKIMNRRLYLIHKMKRDKLKESKNEQSEFHPKTENILKKLHEQNYFLMKVPEKKTDKNDFIQPKPKNNYTAVGESFETTLHDIYYPEYSSQEHISLSKSSHSQTYEKALNHL